MTHSQPHILYMEDDPGVARLFERKLVKLGFKVEIAINGLDGLALCARNTYDLVAVDHLMPGMNGLDVIAELQKLDNSPPVIMVTGAGCERTAALALKMGAQDYIVKDTEGVFFELLPSVIGQILLKHQSELEKQRIEQALRESEQRYRSLVESSPDGILVVVEGTIVYANIASSHLWRKDRDLLTQTRLESHVLDSLVADLHHHLERGLLTTMPMTYKFETTIRMEIGDPIEVEIASVCVVYEGKPALQLVLRDITGRKEVEAAIKEMNLELEFILRDRTSQLESLHREIHRLSSNTAVDRKATDVLHNVKNVLNSLVVSTHTMERIIDFSKVGNVRKIARLLEDHKADLGTFFATTKKGKMVPTFLDSLGEVLERERAMLQNEIHGLIDHLDHINVTVNLQQRRARLGGGEGPMDIEEIIDEALKIANNSITRYDVQLERSRNPWPLLRLDRHKIMQILVNLINNAAKAIDDANREGAERWLRIWCEHKDERLFVHVADHGIGILPEHQERLFEYGFTTRKTGHGFGLHSCKLLSHEMEGELGAHSEGAGLGARFTLILPARPAQPPDGP